MTDDDDLVGYPLEELRPLTAKQETWCLEFIRTSNGVESYRRAYNTQGHWRAINPEVYKLKKLPHIQARLLELRKELAGSLIIDKAQVLNELSKLALFDVRNLYDENGEFKPISELDDNTAASITGIESTRDGPTDKLLTAKVKLADKRAALVDIGKHLGMFTDKVEVTGKDGKDLVPEETSQTEIARRIAFLLTSGMLKK